MLRLLKLRSGHAQDCPPSAQAKAALLRSKNRIGIAYVDIQMWILLFQKPSPEPGGHSCDLCQPEGRARLREPSWLTKSACCLSDGDDRGGFGMNRRGGAQRCRGEDDAARDSLAGLQAYVSQRLNTGVDNPRKPPLGKRRSATYGPYCIAQNASDGAIETISALPHQVAKTSADYLTYSPR